MYLLFYLFEDKDLYLEKLMNDIKSFILVVYILGVGFGDLDLLMVKVDKILIIVDVILYVDFLVFK